MVLRGYDRIEVDEYIAALLEENGALRTEPFTATRFVLMSARPGSGGGPYAVEAEYPFEGTDAFDEADEHFHESRRGD